MQPKLEEVIGYDLAAGATEVVVMPVFWSGRALRSDFPILLSECQEKFPDIVLSATSAVGEDNCPAGHHRFWFQCSLIRHPV